MKRRTFGFLERTRTAFAALSPEAIALILALGLFMGVFPVYGCATLLCAGLAFAFRINLPAIQLVNQLCAPLQIALWIPLGRVGARIVHAAFPAAAGAIAWAPADALRNAVVGWVCCCGPLGLLFYVILVFVLRARQRRIDMTENSI